MCFGLFSYTVCNRFTIFGVWNDCNEGVHVYLAGVIWPWPHFHGLVVKVKFLRFCPFFLTLCAIGHLDLVYWNILWCACQSHRFYLTLDSFTWFSGYNFCVCVLVCFSWTISNYIQLYLLYGRILSCTCLPGMVHLTLTLFSWFIGQCLVFLVKSVS